MSTRFRPGDRVRIINPNHEYTGCRGTVAPQDADSVSGVTVLGHHVAIDGENGIHRPFLVTDLQPLRAVRAGVRSDEVRQKDSEVQTSSE